MWVVGQRVFAELEPELGLGTIIEVTGPRFLEVLFSRAEVTRRYAQRGAPLRRMVLPTGSQVILKSGKKITISGAEEKNGLLMYHGDGVSVWEYEIGDTVEDNSPVHHFLLKHWSPPRAFNLRERAWELRGGGIPSDLRGLIGPRVSLLPHQFYIAHQIASREFPRVLLADEVGLGKTIEAGLIYSSLKALGRAGRVLILVPESLKHQWLAEMYRRFNEMFSVLDEERSEEEEASQGTSAFQMNQKIICSLDFLLENLDRLEEASEEPWDLIIVDEAHHLQWAEDDPSAAWEVVRHLSRRTRGLLLLTATPEHRGTATEFGLLHLVDPERFPDFTRFGEETAEMHTVAEIARKLSAGDRTKKFLSECEKAFKGDPDLAACLDAYAKGGEPVALLRRLVDRHGTGRVLIRNRRSRLRGFPERRFVPYELKSPPAWAEYLKTLPAAELGEKELLALAGGRLRQRKSAAGNAWFQSRAETLLTMLKGLNGEKVLCICSSTARVLELQAWLQAESKLRMAVFHDQLEIVERDRQAAWFAQPDGAQVLLCSEIGGEGRNFQFSRHLYLFDLPVHPDVLEQRIGRLDRIGQARAIQIHVPFLVDTPEEVLLRFYSEGLQSFSQAWSGGGAVEDLREGLSEICRAYLPKAKDHAKRKGKLDKFLEKTQSTVEKIREDQKNSIDLLVDLNSFDETRGKELATRVHGVDVDSRLRDFLDDTFNHFGVETEEMDDEGTLKVSAHSMTFVETFPGLTGKGELLITFDRDHALGREEVSFVSWDHPLAQGAVSLLVEGEAGRASAAIWKDSGQEPRALLEMLFVLEAVAPHHLELERDLPLQVLKVFVDLEGKVVAAPRGLESANLQALPPAASGAVMEKLRDDLGALVDRAAADVHSRAKRLIADATSARTRRMGEEQARLESLAKVNPLVTKREIKEHRTRLDAGVAALKEATPRLEGIRLLLIG